MLYWYHTIHHTFDTSCIVQYAHTYAYSYVCTIVVLTFLSPHMITTRVEDNYKKGVFAIFRSLSHQSP